MHLTLFVHKMTSHNSIGKYRHLVKLTWNGVLLFADQTSRMQNWKEVNVWSSTVYSCDFHEGRHFITLLMFVLNFVLFFNLFTLVIFIVDNISSHC